MKRQRHAASQSLCEARDCGRMNHQVQPYSTRATRQYRSQLSSALSSQLPFANASLKGEALHIGRHLQRVQAFNVVGLKTKYQVTLPPSHRRRHSNCASIMHQKQDPWPEQIASATSAARYLRFVCRFLQAHRYLHPPPAHRYLQSPPAHKPVSSPPALFLRPLAT